MSNQRYAGPITHGTNITPHENEELDRLIYQSLSLPLPETRSLLTTPDSPETEKLPHVLP